MKSFYSKLAIVLALTASASLANAQDALINVSASGTNRSAAKASNHHYKAIAATLTSNTPYVAGTTMKINFKLTLTNGDFEYGDSLAITFPAGITPLGSTDDPIFVSLDTSATPEALNGVSGQTITWGDNDNLYGGIEAGPVISFAVTCAIAPGTTGTKTGTFHVSGDGFNQVAPAADYDGNFQLSDQAAKADFSSLVVNPLTHYSTPIKHATTKLYAIAQNTNADVNSNVNFDFSVSPGGFTESVALMNPFAQDTFEIVVTNNDFVPASAALYTLNGNVNYANDLDASNNASTIDFNVTPDFFCYNTYDTDNAVALGIGAPGWVGAYFHTAVSDKLASVDAWFVKPKGSASASVYEFNTQTATTGNKVFTSAPYTFADSVPQAYSFAMNTTLPAGDYLIVIDEIDGMNIGLGSTPDYFQAQTQYVFFNGTMRDLNSFPAGLHRTFLIKPIFKDGSSVSETIASTIAISSNPGNGVYTISGLAKATVNVMDNLGRIVMTTEINNNKVDITSLPAGNYNLQFVTEQGTAVKKVVMVK